MRTLYESLLDINDVETSVEPIIMIDNWCKDNISGNYTIDKKTLTINSSSSITITNHKLVELPSYIRFGIVNGNFSCGNCDSLESLAGSPKDVGKSFYCSSCTSLKSLKGAPEKVGNSFWCDNCTSLTSLEGAPKEVGVDYYCSDCTSLKSLEGISTHIKGKIYSNIQ